MTNVVALPMVNLSFLGLRVIGVSPAGPISVDWSGADNVMTTLIAMIAIICGRFEERIGIVGITCPPPPVEDAPDLLEVFAQSKIV